MSWVSVVFLTRRIIHHWRPHGDHITVSVGYRSTSGVAKIRYLGLVRIRGIRLRSTCGCEIYPHLCCAFLQIGKIEMICGSFGRKADTKSGLNVHPPADIIVATENSSNSYLYVNMLIFLNVRPVSPSMVDNGFSFRSSAKS